MRSLGRVESALRRLEAKAEREGQFDEPPIPRLFALGDMLPIPLSEWPTELLDRAIALMEAGEVVVDQQELGRGRNRRIEVLIKPVPKALPGPRGLLPPRRRGTTYDAWDD